MTKSRIRAFRHPVHPMLVMFPVALFVTALVFDVVHMITDNSVYAEVGFWTVTAGLVGGVFAAVTGLADWTAVPSATRAKTIGLRHGVLNLVVMVLFLIAWLVRLGRDDHTAGWLTWLELIGVILAAVSAWLGGELVNRHGIGVDDNANPEPLARGGVDQRSARAG